MVRRPKRVHVIVPQQLAGVVSEALPPGSLRSAEIAVHTWSGPTDADSASWLLQDADLHVVFVDAADWMPRALSTALVNSRRCPVSDLLLLGFCEAPGADTDQESSVHSRPWLALLFAAFPRFSYHRLPMSMDQLKKLVRRLLAETTTGKCEWPKDWRRVQEALTDLAGPDRAGSRQMAQAWRVLDDLCGSEQRRLREEHEAAAGLESLMAYQGRLDHYYLAVARCTGATARTILMLEDRPDRIADQLRVLARSTGYTFLLTRNGRDCAALAEDIGTQGQRGLGLQKYDLLSISPNGRKQRQIRDVRDVDVVTVDLMIMPDGGKTLDGEQIISDLHDHYPELPVFVVSRSEEPDVMARCLRTRGADRVVPKRRLLRLPYAVEDYFSREVSPLLPILRHGSRRDGPSLDKELVRLYRLWTHSPGILWHAEKTTHAAEHGMEHHRALWRLANELLLHSWPTISASRRESPLQTGTLRLEEELFCFLLSVWLHDIGCKGNQLYQMGDEVRARHAWISGELIRDDSNELGLAHLPRAYRDAIENLCRYHQSNCPLTRAQLEHIEESAAPTRGLFADKGPLAERARYLLPWEALLRLLDAIEHSWRRVGSDLLHDAKRKALQNEQQYYQLRADQGRLDAQSYVGWLAEQKKHLTKHLGVRDVYIHIESDGNEVLLYPCYAIRAEDDGRRRDLFGDLAYYVLKEWWATGDYLRLLGLRLPQRRPQEAIRQGPWEYQAVWDTPGARARDATLRERKSRLQQRSDEARKQSDQELSSLQRLIAERLS